MKATVFKESDNLFQQSKFHKGANEQAPQVH